jgi:hypothetical protein
MAQKYSGAAVRLMIYIKGWVDLYQLKPDAGRLFLAAADK